MAVDAGQLDHAEDVFFLDRAELEAFIDGNTADMRGGVTERRRINRLQRRLTPPVQLGDLPASFRRALDIAETLRQPLPSAPGERLKGLPASPGRASGPVRVVREAAELARLMPGEVLVVPLLAPAWVPFAVHASAAVVDTGNHLAHACMLAREIGLPCVVGVGDATVQLRFGEWVCVDGGSGVVERVV
jgi:pyruvate,water dikinase